MRILTPTSRRWPTIPRITSTWWCGKATIKPPHWWTTNAKSSASVSTRRRGLKGGTGAEGGANDFRMSDMGPDGNTNFAANFPGIAYNSTNNEYLVVWVGDDTTSPLVDNEFEVFGQRLNAATGAEVGANDFRISDMGPDGSTTF